MAFPQPPGTPSRGKGKKKSLEKRDVNVSSMHKVLKCVPAQRVREQTSFPIEIKAKSCWVPLANY